MRTPAKFELGRTVMTPGIQHMMESEDGFLIEMRAVQLGHLLWRHETGDWGDVCEEDKQENEDALKVGNRLLSAYRFLGQKVWIITEADRSATTVLLPEEY